LEYPVLQLQGNQLEAARAALGDPRLGAWHLGGRLPAFTGALRPVHDLRALRLRHVGQGKARALGASRRVICSAIVPAMQRALLLRVVLTPALLALAGLLLRPAR